MVTLENLVVLLLAVLMKVPLYDQIFVELVENWNGCKIFFGRDIGIKVSQFFSNDKAKTFK